jgi:hypothetical protein
MAINFLCLQLFSCRFRLNFNTNLDIYTIMQLADKIERVALTHRNKFIKLLDIFILSTDSYNI